MYYHNSLLYLYIYIFILVVIFVMIPFVMSSTCVLFAMRLVISGTIDRLVHLLVFRYYLIMEEQCSLLPSWPAGVSITI